MDKTDASLKTFDVGTLWGNTIQQKIKLLKEHKAELVRDLKLGFSEGDD